MTSQFPDTKTHESKISAIQDIGWEEPCQGRYYEALHAKGGNVTRECFLLYCNLQH